MNPPLYYGLVFELPLPHPRRSDMRHDPYIGIRRYVPTLLYASLTIRRTPRHGTKCTREYACWVVATYSFSSSFSLSLIPVLPFYTRVHGSHSSRERRFRRTATLCPSERIDSADVYDFHRRVYDTCTVSNVEIRDMRTARTARCDLVSQRGSRTQFGLVNRMTMEISMRGSYRMLYSPVLFPVPLVTPFRTRAHANKIGRVLIYIVTFTPEIGSRENGLVTYIVLFTIVILW